jgi:D-alanine-D-alanine ligase
VVVYNADYEDEAASAADAKSVRDAANGVIDGLRAIGHRAELIGVHGWDVGELFDRLRRDPPDLIFNQCESLAGDVRNELLLPALLDLLRIPYTGAGTLALGLCLHKERTKEVLVANRIPTPVHAVIHTAADAERAAALGFPLFLKLAHQDASVGIETGNVVRDRDALVRRASDMLERWREPVIAEGFVAGREVNVTILGTGSRVQCLPLHEIDFSAMPDGSPHIVSYAAKWDPAHPEYRGTLPVPLRDTPPQVIAAIEEVATAAFRALELRDFGRVDLRVDAGGQPWVIDINPNCDLSPDAGAARAARSAGIEYPQLLGRICDLAWSRHGHKAARPG